MKNKNKSNNLILLTNGFPYGDGEQFLETEILNLANHYNKVFVFPIAKLDNDRALPANVYVILFERGQVFNSKKMFFSNFFVFIKVLLYERKKLKLYRIKGLRFHFNNFLGDLNDAINFSNYLDHNFSQDTIIYSYWFGSWGNIMSLVNDISKRKWNFVSRIHGYDYDATRKSDGLLPFRSYQLSRVNCIASVSKFAINRILTEYPQFKRIYLHRLGVNDYGSNPKKTDSEVFTFVSCSSFIKLKRVHLIVELLRQFKKRVDWVHFGDGPLRNEIELLAKDLPSNISYNFRGLVPNAEIIDFYKSNNVDLFINVSELEGIPVSIMEAISFGIPSVGCNICGVPEIVTSRTGILLDENFDIKSSASRIIDFLEMPIEEKDRFRKGVKEFWFENFNARVNYENFINEILSKN